MICALPDPALRFVIPYIWYRIVIISRIQQGYADKEAW